MNREKFCIHDNILDNIDFIELIETIQTNESKINEATIKQIFNELVKQRIEDSRHLLNVHMKDILNQIEQ